MRVPTEVRNGRVTMTWGSVNVMMSGKELEKLGCTWTVPDIIEY